jgi:hypothetical protein
VVNRSDCEIFRPCHEADLLFAQVLHRAYKKGVQLIAKDIIWDQEQPQPQPQGQAIDGVVSTGGGDGIISGTSSSTRSVKGSGKGSDKGGGQDSGTITSASTTARLGKTLPIVFDESVVNEKDIDEDHLAKVLQYNEDNGGKR